MRDALAGAFLALALLACRGEPAQSGTASEPKPRLNLLTSLPLVFSESFGLDAPKHPLTARLEQDFNVQLVDGPEELPPSGLLLAVQPQALTAERLVQLDRWVREGGRIVLLADPRLTWESSRSLADAGRPPFAYPDTGLLRHWGLRLSVGEQNGLAERRLGGNRIVTDSPGALEAQPGGSCEVSADALVARCSLGRGRAVVIADADFVQAGPIEGNHEALAVEVKAAGQN